MQQHRDDCEVNEHHQRRVAGLIPQHQRGGAAEFDQGGEGGPSVWGFTGQEGGGGFGGGKRSTIEDGMSLDS